MSPDDTAVAEEVTASSAAAQQDQELAPVTPEIAAEGSEPETESIVAPETAERQPIDLDGLSDDEIAELPQVKGLLARTGEAQRRQALAEADSRRKADLSAYHDTQAYVDEFDRVIKAAVNDGESVKPEVLRARLGALVTTRDEFAVSTILGIVDGMIQPDIPVTKATADRYNSNVAAYQAKRISLPEYVRNVALTLAEQIAEAHIRPQLEKAWKEEWDKAQETKRLQQNGQARGQGKRPTAIIGATPSYTPLTVDQASTLPVSELIRRRAQQRGT